MCGYGAKRERSTVCARKAATGWVRRPNACSWKLKKQKIEANERAAAKEFMMLRNESCLSLLHKSRGGRGVLEDAFQGAKG